MYEVYWAPSALDQLAALWTDADAKLRGAITVAAADIDSLLARSPNDVGESRPDNRRITFVAPIGLIFEVRSADQRVVVNHVWSIRHREN